MRPKKTEAELLRLDPNRNNEDQVAVPKPKPKPKASPRRKKRKRKPDEDEYSHKVGTPPPRRQHPRRARRRPQRQGFDGGHEDIHSLLPLEPFYGDQPFRVVACPNALLLADLHAHLSHEVEIIGFLAGRYDIESKTLFVEAIYPCKSAVVEDGEHNVEADPEAQVQILTDVERRNMTIVGWYHSHPTFAAQPSVKDVATHREHQSLFKAGHDFSPFIGLIVGPYNASYGLEESEMKFFVVNEETESPMQLLVDHKVTTTLDDVFAGMTTLVDHFPVEEYQTKILSEWAPRLSGLRNECEDDGPGQNPWQKESYEGSLGSQTRLTKIGRSLYLHMNQSDNDLCFAEKVVDMLSARYEFVDEEESEDEEMEECSPPVIDVASSSEMDVDDRE